MVRLAFASACFGALAITRCNGDDSNACDGGVDACAEVAPTPLTVSATPEEIWVKPGDAPNLAIALTRGPGGDGDVAVTIENDAGATEVADPLTIPAASQTGTLVVHIPIAAPQGTVTLTIDAQTSTTLAQASLLVHVNGASGTLDTSFANAGIADLSPSSGQDRAASMIVYQNGIFVGGTHIETADAGSISTIKVLRLTNGGGVDGTFAATTAPANVMSDLRSIAMLTSGEVYAVGDLVDTKSEFAAVRVLANGGLDPTYAVVTPISLGDDVAYAGAIEPGGNLVAAGSENDASAIAVARYTQAKLPPPPPNDAGSDADAAAVVDSAITSHLDPTFAEGGVLSVPLSTAASSSSLLIAPDGSLYVLGRQSDTTAADVAFVHVTTGGAVEKTTTVPLLNGQTGAAAALLNGDGTILVASDDGGQALVLRLLSTGALDTTFGYVGRTMFGTGAAARAIATDPGTGNVLFGGTSGTQCFIARLTPIGALDKTFATGGSVMITEGDACAIVAIGVDNSGLIDVLANVTTGGASHMNVARYWP